MCLNRHADHDATNFSSVRVMSIARASLLLDSAAPAPQHTRVTPAFPPTCPTQAATDAQRAHDGGAAAASAELRRLRAELGLLQRAMAEQGDGTGLGGGGGGGRGQRASMADISDAQVSQAVEYND
jgi:hypothetical protein